jgi:acetyl esterase/lipase
VLDDITSFLKTVIPCPIPLFLMGHSMGGGEVLCYAATGPAEVRKHIRGYLLEAPFVDFSPASKPSFVTVFFGRLAGKILPHHQMVNKLDVKLVSRDPAVQKQMEADDLCHDTGTLEGLAGLLDRTGELASGKIKIGDGAGEGGVTRIWIAHGDKDGITNYHASKALAERIEAQDKEFKTYEGYFHRREYDVMAFCMRTADFCSTRRAASREGKIHGRRCELDPDTISRASPGRQRQVQVVKETVRFAQRQARVLHVCYFFLGIVHSIQCGVLV